jgi:hypothetical protein
MLHRCRDYDNDAPLMSFGGSGPAGGGWAMSQNSGGLPMIMFSMLCIWVRPGRP